MIEQIPTHIQGQVNNSNLNEIKDHIVDMIEHNYEKTLDPKVSDTNKSSIDKSTYAAYLMFGQEHRISINSKNIEFSESFHYENWRPQTEQMTNMIKRGVIKDFLIRLFIYRLGQHSYYAAEITPLIDNVIDCGAC